MMGKDDKLIENIRQVLDQSIYDVDAATQSRFTQARHLAMERQQKFRFIFWGSVPAAALLLLLLLLNWPSAPLVPVAVPQIDDLSIMTAAEPLEFYQEEIEFYEWLSEEFETEKELSGDALQSAVPVAEQRDSAGRQFAGTAESRTARLFGVI